MTHYDFDKIVDRTHSGSVKFDGMQELFGRSDLTPLWVADMDFETPPFIVDALKQRLDHAILGYTVVPPDYKPTIVSWLKQLHGWDVNSDWLTFIPGIVRGIGMVVNVFTEVGDKVIIQPPVYHPFRLVPTENGRQVVMNPLIETADGGYRMDFDHLESIAPGCKLLILSNPHNPAGIVWDEETLRRVADICHRHGVIVISDEIHSEMVLWGNHHHPFASVSPEAAECSISFAAPSKTFNIAGVVSSYAIVPNPRLREKFFGWLAANEFDSPTMFAPIATIAAYTQGEQWRREMLHYVEGNIDFVIDFCRRHIPAIKPRRPQASFLVWLDCRDLGLSHDALVDLFVNKAHLALNDGEMFGHGGEGFMRLNVASPRSILSSALTQLQRCIDSL